MTSAEPPVDETTPADSGPVDGGPALRASTVVASRNGLHLRPSTEFARIASQSGCEVRVEMGERDANGASVIELAMLAARHGTPLEIVVRGEAAAAEATLRDLVTVVESRETS